MALNYFLSMYKYSSYKLHIRNLLVCLKTNKILILSFFLFLSCSKSDKILEKNEIIINQGKLLLNKVNFIVDPEVKMFAYGSLTPRERYSIWIAKLTEKLNSNALTNQQYDITIEIRNYLSEEIFTKGSVAREVFYSVWFPKWVVKAQKVFSGEEIYYNFFTLNPVVDLNKSNSRVGQRDAPKNCICAVNAYFTCSRFTDEYPPNIPVHEWGECTKVGSCTSTTSGCGALWDNECDGDTCTYD